MDQYLNILYPLRIDLWNPIQTIHRQLANNLPEYYNVNTLSESADGIDPSIPATVYPAPSESSSVKKLGTYLRMYSKTYDIIHTGPACSRDRLAKLSKLRGSQVVHTLHAAPENPDTVKTLRALVDQADAVTAISPYISEWAESTFDIDITAVIPDGVDLDLFHPDKADTEKSKVLFAGRLISQKHPELVVEIANQLPNYEFDICGSGPFEEQLEQVAPENVTIHSHLRRKKLSEFYAKATVTLCPGEREGFGMVALESLASGTPVIAYNSGNHPYLITDDCGLICGTHNPNEWVNSVKEVSEMNDLFSPRTVAEPFSWERITSQYENIYQDMVET